MGLLSVSIDLDEIDCYHAIYGLSAPDTGLQQVVYERALPRAAELVEELGIRATFFAVGKNIAGSAEAARLLTDLRRRGHEVGNHTMSHRYDFTLLDSRSMLQEIEEGERTIARLVGESPRGFRAPGYNVHSGVMSLLAGRDYLYDSSVFPCPLYFSAKAAAIGLMSIRGRRSATVMGDPRVLGAPSLPYRMAEENPWIRGQGLTELPISVVTKARLPFISMFLFFAGSVSTRLLTRSAAKLPFLNLVLHGMDFIDAEGDGLGYLKKHQSDLRLPYTKKRRILEETIKGLLDAGFDGITLANAAERMLI